VGDRIRMTEWTSCGGCAAKWGASLLAELVVSSRRISPRPAWGSVEYAVALAAHSRVEADLTVRVGAIDDTSIVVAGGE
jgi:hypothetical protein